MQVDVKKVGGIGGSVSFGEVACFIGGCEYLEPNCWGMIVNDVGASDLFNFDLLKEIFGIMMMSYFAQVKDFVVVETDMKEKENSMDRWDQRDIDYLETQGVTVVVRKNDNQMVDGYASCEDDLGASIESEERYKCGLCGAAFSFGGGNEMRIQIEMAAGCVVRVFETAYDDVEMYDYKEEGVMSCEEAQMDENGEVILFVE